MKIKPLLMKEHKGTDPQELIKKLNGIYYKFMILVSNEIKKLDENVEKIKDLGKAPTREDIKSLSLNLKGVENLRHSRVIYLSQHIYIIDILWKLKKWDDLENINFKTEEGLINPVALEMWGADKNNFKKLAIAFYDRSKKDYEDLKNLIES